jgi:NADH-quinone oxidoreductase subunit M
MLNGFVGEFLILLGTYQRHWNWAAWAATGVILSACYLLWAYQRVFFGETVNAKNRELKDLSMREFGILVTMAVITLWMGIGSTYFTSRTAAASRTVIEQVNRNENAWREVAAPVVKPATAANTSGAVAAPVSTERVASR